MSRASTSDSLLNTPTSDGGKPDQEEADTRRTANLDYARFFGLKPHEGMIALRGQARKRHQRWICKLCPEKLPIQTRSCHYDAGSTSSRLRHLRKHHPRTPGLTPAPGTKPKFPDGQRGIVESLGIRAPRGQRVYSGFDISKMHDLLLDMIVERKLPFEIVESHALEALVSRLAQRDVRLLTADAMRRRLEKRSLSAREELKDETAAATGNIPLTLDAWTLS